MNKKIVLKIVIDIIMLILFLLELNMNITGLYLHELFGLLAGGLIITHLILNNNWIKNINKVLKSRNFTLVFSAVTNVCLLIFTIIMMITGIIISKELFSFNVFNSTIIFIHKLSAYITGITILIHLAFHYNFSKNIICKVINNEEISVFKKILLIIVIIFLGIFSMYTIIENIALNFSISSENNNSYRENINEQIDDKYLNDVRHKRHDDYYKNEEKENEENNKDDEEDDIINNSNEDDSSKPTMEEFLGNLFCNGCGRHCSLLSPRCGRGYQQQNEAKVEYNEKYYN